MRHSTYRRALRQRHRDGLVTLVLLTAAILAAACGAGGRSRSVDQVGPSPTTTTSFSTVGSARLPCPVPSDICELAHAFVPAIRTGDAQRIVDQATPQRLTCPSGGPAAAEYAVVTVCAGHEAGTTISVYEMTGGKAPRYYTDREDFADAVAANLRQLGPLEVEIAAVGCGVSSTMPGETPSCDRSGIVLYEVWDEDVYLALVFTRSHPGADWGIETYWGIFPSAVPNPITSGARIAAYTFTGADGFEIYPYSPR